MTRTPLSRSKGQRSRSPGRFTHRRVNASGSCSGERGNFLTVRNYCYVAVCLAARGASAPTEGGEGRGHIVAVARLQLVTYAYSVHQVNKPAIMRGNKGAGTQFCDTLQSLRYIILWFMSLAKGNTTIRLTVVMRIGRLVFHGTFSTNCCMCLSTSTKKIHRNPQKFTSVKSAIAYYWLCHQTAHNSRHDI